MSSMKLLALELSTVRGSLAWRENDDAAFVREWPNDRQNSGAFFENLKLASQKFGAPDKIIVGLGPGSYAGIRIAISAAIGLSLAGGTGRACPEPAERVPSQNLGRHGGRPSIQLVGFPSICAMAGDATEYYVVGDARRQSFFFARVCDNDLADGPTLLTETELQSKLENLESTMSIFSSDKLPQFARVELRYPSAELLARLAQEARRSFASPPLEPMYLREPHITAPRSWHRHPCR